MDKKEIETKIKELKHKLNAVILAHNYQIPDVQDIADFVGDSLGLSMKAMETDAEVIVFCGVDFMAESAKILNPDKIVVHPDKKAQCPMAAMVDVESLGWFKDKNPQAVVVAYVNTTADVKAVTDVCCTSSNAIKVIKSVKEKDVIFIPDTNLGLYVKRFIHDKNLILWPGICPTHHRISEEEILEIKKQHQNAEIIVHPECRPEVIDIADHVFSTQGMVNYVSKADSKEFIIGTEKELCYRLKKENLDKTFYSLKSAVCPNMKRITLEKVLKSMKSLEPKVELSETTIEKAKLPLQRMIDIGRGD
ncbi:MAG: quinolinate synthase NadA [Thermoplasmatales archaeon]|nr:MAG: quinolinate synthase NadA [Thermoplasmatales archaeon]